MHQAQAHPAPATPRVLNPHLQSPELPPAALARLYDNNADPRNLADLAALRALSASSFAGALRQHTHRLGPAEHEAVDVFLPAGTGGGAVPALVFVHGGRWRINTSRETAFWADACVKAGFALVGINFPKLGTVPLAEVVAAVRRAVTAVVVNAAELGIDPGALVLGGHSSGAHLALAAALLDASAPGMLRRAPWLPRLRAMYLLGGMYDLRPLARTAAPAQLGFDAAEAEAMSPVLALDGADASGTALRFPPVLVGAGADESPEFLRQARALHWALGRVAEAELQLVHGASHFDAALEFNAPDSVARAFVRGHLAAGR